MFCWRYVIRKTLWVSRLWEGRKICNVVTGCCDTDKSEGEEEDVMLRSVVLLYQKKAAMCKMFDQAELLWYESFQDMRS